MISIKGSNWKIHEINAILFDKDGTIIDSHFYWGEIIKRRANSIISFFQLDYSIFHKMCRQMGFDLDQNRLLKEGPIALVHRNRVIEIVNDFLRHEKIPSSVHIIDSLFNEVHHSFLPSVENYIKLIPFCYDFIVQLKQKNIKMGIVTTDTCTNTIETLEKLNIRSFFQTVVGKESSSDSKETGIPALIALEELKCKKEYTICIGDAPMDMKMAQKSNCKAAIGIASGQLPKTELDKYSLFTANDFSELTLE